MTITRARARAERVLQNYLDELLSDEDFLANTAEIESAEDTPSPSKAAVSTPLPAEVETQAQPAAANQSYSKPTAPQLFDAPVEVALDSALDSQLDQALHQATSNPELDIAFENAFAAIDEVAHESRQTLADLEPVTDGVQIPVIKSEAETAVVEAAVIEQPVIEAPVAKTETLPTLDRQVIEAPLEQKMPAVVETPKLSASEAEPEQQEGFQCLVFRVKDMALAVRLDALGGIHKQAGHPVKLPGQPDWYLGVYQSERGNIQVVDTKAWVMGELSELDDDEDREQLLLQIADTRWGLMCDKVDGTETIQMDQVRWRESRKTRPWLCGMLVDRMCALLDLQELSQLLDQAASATKEGLNSEMAETQAARS